MKLYIIAGHGAGDPGATGGGKTEADLVRKLAAKMKEIGGSSVEVLDTSRNWYADGGVNSALKKKVGSNPVMELHLDAASSTAKGGHVIIKSGYSADKYGKALSTFLKKYFPGRSEVIVKRGNLANINRAATLGINYRLVEVCFITNTADRTKLISNMDEVARGLLDAFGISTNEYTAIKNTYTYSKHLWNKDYRVKKVKKGDKIAIKSTWHGKKYLWGITYEGTYVNLTKCFKK